jgi:hypothetical protein
VRQACDTRIVGLEPFRVLDPHTTSNVSTRVEYHVTGVFQPSCFANCSRPVPTACHGRLQPQPGLFSRGAPLQPAEFDRARLDRARDRRGHSRLDDVLVGVAEPPDYEASAERPGRSQHPGRDSRRASSALRKRLSVQQQCRALHCQQRLSRSSGPQRHAAPDRMALADAEPASDKTRGRRWSLDGLPRREDPSRRLGGSVRQAPGVADPCKGRHRRGPGVPFRRSSLAILALSVVPTLIVAQRAAA